VDIGASCTLYKECKICSEIKYKTEFPKKSGTKSRPSQRRSFCYSCDRSTESLFYEPAKGYSFDTSLLNKYRPIGIHGLTSKERLYRGKVSYERAKRLVSEGAAGIVYSTLIHHLFTTKTFRTFIFERDNFTCHYCSKPGNTIDHKRPRSKGGYSTPENCVCACRKCNHKKDNIAYEDYVNKVKV